MKNLNLSLIRSWMINNVMGIYNLENKFRGYIEKLLIKTNILKGAITQNTISKIEGTTLGVFGFIVFYVLISGTKLIIKK